MTCYTYPTDHKTMVRTRPGCLEPVGKPTWEYAVNLHMELFSNADSKPTVKEVYDWLLEEYEYHSQFQQEDDAEIDFTW